MRASAILGTILLVGGVLAFVLDLTYPKEHTLVEVGDVKASVTEQRRIPTWVAGGAVAAGVILLATAAMSRKRS